MEGLYKPVGDRGDDAVDAFFNMGMAAFEIGPFRQGVLAPPLKLLDKLAQKVRSYQAPLRPESTRFSSSSQDRAAFDRCEVLLPDAGHQGEDRGGGLIFGPAAAFLAFPGHHRPAKGTVT